MNTQCKGCESHEPHDAVAAFYRDSLLDGDYRAAFERAVRLVREREESKGFRHSEPQIWVGEEIGGKLPLAAVDAGGARAATEP